MLSPKRRLLNIRETCSTWISLCRPARWQTRFPRTGFLLWAGSVSMVFTLNLDDRLFPASSWGGSRCRRRIWRAWPSPWLTSRQLSERFSRQSGGRGLPPPQMSPGTTWAPSERSEPLQPFLAKAAKPHRTQDTNGGPIFQFGVDHVLTKLMRTIQRHHRPLRPGEVFRFLSCAGEKYFKRPS